MISAKWQNIRDAFTRSLRKQSTQANIRKYVYHKQLKFLLKTDEKDEYPDVKCPEIKCPEINIKVENEIDSEFESSSQMEVSLEAPLSPEASPEATKNKFKRDGIDRDDITERQLLHKRKSFANEDEAFFFSIYPSISTMKENEKLEFRMGVLRLIQEIKQRNSFQEKQIPFNSPVCSSCDKSNSVAGPGYILSD